MGFANSYFEKQKGFEVKIENKPLNDLKFSVVIPCFNEPDVLETLNSIKECQRPNGIIEVIIVINSAENSKQQVLDQNKKTLNEVKNWIDNHSDSSLSFYVISEINLDEKFAGAGLTRKIGMDQAIHRFNEINREDGVIISMDADSKMKSNYFIELEKHFEQYPKTNAITTYFEHPLVGNDFDKEVYDAIAIYELYLRYYKLALKHTGFPYSYYTIGSCFAVSAKAYIKQGGMNRKQAGEDFYFLHKIFPLAQCYEINTTCVYPSPRISDRVPFGTGPMVQSIINSEKEFLTYDLRAFTDLKKFFQVIDRLYKLPTIELSELLYQMPLAVVDFLSDNDIHTALEEINENSSSLKTFIKRFFDWFNAFRILKYMNATAEKFYPKQPLIHEADKLLVLLKRESPEIKVYKNYLEAYRNLEKGF